MPTTQHKVRTAGNWNTVGQGNHFCVPHYGLGETLECAATYHFQSRPLVVLQLYIPYHRMTVDIISRPRASDCIFLFLLLHMADIGRLSEPGIRAPNHRFITRGVLEKGRSFGVSWGFPLAWWDVYACTIL